MKRNSEFQTKSSKEIVFYRKNHLKSERIVNIFSFGFIFWGVILMNKTWKQGIGKGKGMMALEGGCVIPNV